MEEEEGLSYRRRKSRCTREEAEEAKYNEQALFEITGVQEVDAEPPQHTATHRNAVRTTRRRRKTEAAIVTQVTERGSHDRKGEGKP